MMSTIRLYCPAIVLSVWAGTVAAGVSTTGSRVTGLTATAVSLAVHTWEERRNAR